MNVMIQLVTGALGSVGFGMIFHINKRYLPAAALGGALGWLVYLLLSNNGNHMLVSMLVASFCVAVYAEILARMCCAPPIPSANIKVWLPYVPASSMFPSASALIQ